MANGSPILQPATIPNTIANYPFTATQHVHAVITSGTALSSIVDMTQPDVYGYIPTIIVIPAAWTAAKVSIQVSIDGSNWGELHNWTNGNYDTQNNAAANDALIMDGYPLRGVLYFRIRSGTSGTPVNQSADRTLTVILATF